MNRRRRRFLGALGTTGVAALSGCTMFSGDGTESPDVGTGTVSTTAGPTDTQPAGATDTTATTGDGEGATGQITTPPDDIVNAIEVVDAGSDISFASIYGEENVTWNDGKAELQIDSLNEFSLYAIYEGTRNLKTYYDMNASERKMNISPTFINSGTVEGILIPRSVERDGQQLIEVTTLVDGEFVDFVEDPLRIAGGSGSINEWTVTGQLNPDLVHEENVSVHGSTAYLDVVPEDLQGAIVGTFSRSDLGEDRYYNNMQVGIEMTV